LHTFNLCIWFYVLDLHGMVPKFQYLFKWLFAWKCINDINKSNQNQISCKQRQQFLTIITMPKWYTECRFLLLQIKLSSNALKCNCVKIHIISIVWRNWIRLKLISSSYLPIDRYVFSRRPWKYHSARQGWLDWTCFTSLVKFYCTTDNWSAYIFLFVLYNTMLLN
jgi:hypothetical protein